MMRKYLFAAAFAVVAAIGACPAFADETENLAKQLSNPIADLISVPFQGNYNQGIGPAGDGSQTLVNFQPVIPIKLNDDWNVISRTILPITSQTHIFPGAGSQFGLGNTLQSLFFSPARPMNGIIWGAGPVMLLPTATDDLLGLDKWGAGPTGVALWQGGPWTVGILANQIWSFAGNPDEPDINQAFFQPFVAYTTPDAWTFSFNTESTYNWNTEQWAVPFNAVVAKLVTIDRQPISFFVGARYWAISPDETGPSGWGARFGMTFLFPTRGG